VWRLIVPGLVPARLLGCANDNREEASKSTRGRVSPWVSLLVAAPVFIVASACDRDGAAERAAQRPKPPSMRAPSASVAATQPSNDPTPRVAPSVEGETLCSEREVGGDDQGNVAVVQEVYSFPKLNQQLAKYPELARWIGLEQVRTCADARLFAERYHRFLAEHPGFDAPEGRSKADSILR
jgi:hypothetical protein